MTDCQVQARSPTTHGSAKQSGCDLMSPLGREKAPNVHQAAGLRRASGLPASARLGPKCAKTRRLSHPASRRRTDSPQSHSSWHCWSDVRVQVGYLPTEVAMLNARRRIPRPTDAEARFSRRTGSAVRRRTLRCARCGTWILSIRPDRSQSVISLRDARLRSLPGWGNDPVDRKERRRNAHPRTGGV